MRIALIILSFLLFFSPVLAQDADTISVEQAKVKTRTFFDELFMFRMAADVFETRALISDNELGDSVENYMDHYDNALFFISRLEYDFFWNNILGRKKYKVPSSKLFLDSKDSYINKNEPGSSIDFDIVLTPQWEDPATEDKVKDYKVQINTANYTNVAFTTDQKEHLQTVLNSPFTENYSTPKDAAVNEAVFNGLAELRKLLTEAQKPVEIGLQLYFKPYESQQFGFDKLTYDVHKPTYIKRTYNGNEMYLPWKSVSSSGIDQVLLEVSDNDEDYSPGDVKFKTAAGTTISATNFEGKDNLFLVNVTGKTHESVEEIQAYINYEIDEETNKEVVLGGLNTISYDKKSINLIIVPVNEAASFSASQFTAKLNEIYKQSVVEWKVTLDDVFEINESEWDLDGDHKMNDGESTFLSDYSDEQLALKRKYKQERDIDKQAYYVFLLNNIPSKSGLAGYMPLKKQYAYIHSATDENAAQLIAHELGHGAFRLWHTFSSNSDYFMPRKTSDNLMDYNDGERLHKYQWDLIHDPQNILFAWAQDEEEGAMQGDDLNRLLRILKHSGTNSFAFGIKCPTMTTESDGMVFKIKGESYHVFFMKYSYVGEEIEISSYDFDESSIPTNLNVEGIDIPDELDKFIVLNQMDAGEVVSHLCTQLQEDYSKACQTGSLNDVDNLYTKFGNDIMQCFDALELSPGGYTLPEITGILTQLQSEARENQQFEFTQNGLVYSLNEQGLAEIIEDAPSDADINTGNWTDESIDMKMRVGYNADGIFQFAAIGIRKNLQLAKVDGEQKTATLTDISANMLAKNNALLKEHQVKDIEATLNSVGANLDSDAFPDGKKVEIDKSATFVKILCEAGGVGVAFLKTAEIEQPVYLADNPNTIKAPPIGTGSLEGGAMAVTDITSMATMIHDLVTDKDARAEAREGFKAIKEQVVDDPSLLFPILGEIALEEFTGSGSEGFEEMLNTETNQGRKGHLVSKTSVRTATSVFATGKFITKLPDMAIKMAAKMPKAKLWLRFRSLDEALSADLLKKLDDLPDGGNKFLDDFAGASDETLNKFLNKPELIEAWKKMDNLGADDALRQNTGALEALSKPHKSRPDPSEYLDKGFIDNHLNKFNNDDIVRVTTQSKIDKFGSLGPDDAFVMPKSEFDKMLLETGRDLRKIEKKLGFEPNSLSDDAVFALIKREDVGSFKIPSGNESGVSPTKWLPGGKTSGGISEAIVDLSKKVDYTPL